MWRRVAVAVSERLHRLVEPGEDVRLAVGLDPRDLALQVGDTPERLRVDDPVRRLVEPDHADLVASRQGRGGAQDRLLADVDLAHARRSRSGCRLD